ncbi:MAG: type IV secretion system DNA-binding domain-containing protein [Chitinophagales bacterium]|nr:type IV secretion system DNA-binding domain-containing protein [Chitinophagales bacterium]
MGYSLQERLTIQFYNWERRGRGWYVFEDTVHLEPEFVPFFGHFLPQTTEFVDDGLQKTIFQKVFDLLKEKPKEQVEETESWYDEVKSYIYDEETTLTALRIVIPKAHKVNTEQNEALLLMLSNTELPVSFEIIGTNYKIHIQFVCSIRDSAILKSQLKAFFPEVIITENLAYLDDVVSNKGYGYIIDFGLKEEFMRPLEMENKFRIDPFTPFFGILDNLQELEQISLQVLFTKVVNPWSESVVRSVMDDRGDAFFTNAPEMVKLAQQKISSPLFAATIRLVAQSHNEDSALQLIKNASASVLYSSQSPFNSLIPLQTELYDFETRLKDIRLRESHRIGMILNGKELANFVHIPNESITSAKIDRDIKKTNPAPITQSNDYIFLGKNEHQGKISEVKEDIEERLKHTHIIGGTGTGKSTLILQLIKQDIEASRGVCVLDPHGDLIETVISLIPQNRIQDVLIIDPADSEFPVAFNILEAHSDIEKEILSSDLVGGFKRLSTSWGDQMNSVLANAILAFLESNQGGTLTDLRRFLIEKDFRNDFLKTVTDPSIQYYWLKEYPLLKSNSIGSILTRLDTFLRPKVIRNMVAQKKGINFQHLINTNKIILVKLSQGLIGVENSYLLGTFVVSKIHQAIMARQAMEKQARNPFFLYIDEFQNFITPSMGAILSGARKYHLGLVLAHQDLAQLIKNDSEIASSVLANAGTRICFRLSDTDAKRLAEGFSHFESTDLQNLSVGEAIARIGRPDNDFNLETVVFNTQSANDKYQLVIDSSRLQYASTRKEVEKLLLKSYEGIVIQTPEVEQYAPKVKEEVQSSEVVKVPVEELNDQNVKESIVKREEQSKHRYLQTLVKRMAESRGFVATIEQPLVSSHGYVDVSLERNGVNIAIEICVTTPKEWEVHNIYKCLDEGYSLVIECSDVRKNLDRIKTVVKQKLTIEQQERVKLFEPEELFQFLDELIIEKKPSETRMKGYRVKVSYDSVSNNELKAKKESITKAVLDSIKKIK